jgi:hypothetical protein
MAEHLYIRVCWLHSSSDEPVDLWSELDADRYEVRKVEIWSEGRMGYASGAAEIGGTWLGKVPVPSLNEINLDPQFQAQMVTKADFDARWLQALEQG